MKDNKYFRLIRVSMILYLSNFKRNIHLTISVSVSVFLFLMVALYMDFNYATYVKGSNRVQDNYIAVTCNSKDAFDTIFDNISNKNSLICRHTRSGSVISGNFDAEINVDYNVICVDKMPDNIFIHSSLEAFGNEDVSNEYNYEKFELIAGRQEFQSENEVIISEAYAKRLGSDINEVLGMQIFMGNRGVQDAYKVVGIYKQILTETRMNDCVYKELMSIDENGETHTTINSLIYTVFMPVSAFDESDINSWDIYLFYHDSKQYKEYLSILQRIRMNDEIANRYEYITPELLESSNIAEWSANLQVKAILMLIIAVISGISVFGTMVNSVADRRKEIGIKKSLGASDGDVMFGFVIENIVNSGIAIIFAVAMASAAFVIYTYYQRQIVMIDYVVKFYPLTIVLFICYTISVVLGFSLIPAYSATQVNIIDTLRDE